MNINGFEFTAQPNGRLHVDDGAWPGHRAVTEFADRVGGNGDGWSAFWDKWLARRDAALDKAMQRYFALQ